MEAAAPGTVAGPCGEGGGPAPGRAPHPVAALRQLLATECDEQTSRLLLQDHTAVLMNLAEVAMRTPVGEAGLREFLRFISRVHVRAGEDRVAREHAEWHCEALRRQLHSEREGRNADGFRLALGAMGQNKALEAERQARCSLEAQLRSMGSRLAYTEEQHQRQAHELQLMNRCFAEAEVGMEEKLRVEVQRQQELLEAGHQRAMDYLRAQCEQKIREARQAEVAARGTADQERSGAAACRDQTAQLDFALEPFRALQAARLQCVIELTRFLHKTGPALLDQALPTQASVPVLALEWPPHTELHAALEWRSLDEHGFFGLLSQLCRGELRPELLELTVCCVEGRWLGALHGDAEAPRLAALLAFQALRPDVMVSAHCRVVPMKKALLPRGVLELSPAVRSSAPVGEGRVRGGQTGPSWKVDLHPRPSPTVAADADEARLRSVLRGCPLEREVLSALCYVRAAYPDALSRPPPPPSALPQMGLAVA